MHSVISRVDIIIINDEEALQLSGKDTSFCCCSRNHDLWTCPHCDKKGEHGAMLFGESQNFLQFQLIRFIKLKTLLELVIVLLEALQDF